jgi:RNA polymerase sigma factor (TIGR02999 family)
MAPVSCILGTVSDAGAITVLLQRSRGGDHDALNELLPIVYDDLRAHAGRLFKDEHRAVTLQPTALVNEAYLRLLGHSRNQWNDRNHFFAVASRLMRQILVDYARARHADKRGGPHTQMTLGSVDDDRHGDEEARIVAVLNLDGLLDRLAARNARQAQVVELRVFGGLSVEETAEALEMSPRTIKTDWQLARAWLSRELA